MTKLSEMLQETTQFILDKGVKEIDFGLILGSGLGELADEIEDAVMISYDEIPFFPVSTVVGHALTPPHALVTMTEWAPSPAITRTG